MNTYKVRRKLDGKCARNQGAFYNYNRCSWGVGQVYSERSFLNALRLYNIIGSPDYKWINSDRVPIEKDHYDKIELVKFGPTGEVVVWTGSYCKLTAKEAAKFEPIGQAEPTLLAKQAGIRDEIGPLLDKIEQAETALDSGQSIDINKIFADIETKEFKLKVALDELNLRNQQFREKIKNIF